MNLNGKTINPGECRTCVTFESRGVTTGDGGYQTETWTVVREVWVKWSDVHGSEVWAAESAGVKRAATILARYKGDVDETWSVVFGRSSQMTEAARNAARYEIVSMDNIQRRGEWMEFKLKAMKST